MGMTDKLWDAFSTVIKMNDKVMGLASTAGAQQAKIEDLTARVIRLETALEIALSGRSTAPRRRLPGPDQDRS
jgi:hypothetical protein